MDLRHGQLLLPVFIRNGAERGIGMHLELSAGCLEVCREPFQRMRPLYCKTSCRLASTGLLAEVCLESA